MLSLKEQFELLKECCMRYLSIVSITYSRWWSACHQFGEAAEVLV